MWKWQWPSREIKVRASTYIMLALVSLLVAAILFGDPQRKVSAIIYDWQTLIAGLFALLAAWISLQGPRAQIEQIERHNRESRIRDESASKSLLLIPIDAINKYARSCAVLSIETFKTGKANSGPMSLPYFDRSNLLMVRDAIRFAPELHRDRMLLLIKKIHLMEEEAQDRAGPARSFHFYISCVDIDYLCDLISDYAMLDLTTWPDDAPTYPHAQFLEMSAYSDGAIDLWPDFKKYIARQKIAEVLKAKK